ncbi:MAG: hypothetical protein M1463_03880 [Candidatus Thermoplasmatota archaeon]|jgi:hypothetical protein|nr:hypothetical protein [Candidatus Thermoplasmatota archaeon]
MTANKDTSEIVQEKEEQKMESRYTFQKGDISKDRFSEIESISEEIGRIWQEHNLSILELKSLLPYLASMIFLEAEDSDYEVLDYIENYMKPAVFEYSRTIRNSKKFKAFDYHTTVAR